MLLCGHNILAFRFPHVFFPQIWARKGFAHEAYIFGSFLKMALFFPEF